MHKHASKQANARASKQASRQAGKCFRMLSNALHTGRAWVERSAAITTAEQIDVGVHELKRNTVATQSAADITQSRLSQQLPQNSRDSFNMIDVRRRPLFLACVFRCACPEPVMANYRCSLSRKKDDERRWRCAPPRRLAQATLCRSDGFVLPLPTCLTLVPSLSWQIDL